MAFQEVDDKHAAPDKQGSQLQKGRLTGEGQNLRWSFNPADILKISI